MSMCICCLKQEINKLSIARELRLNDSFEWFIFTLIQQNSITQNDSHFIESQISNICTI